LSGDIMPTTSYASVTDKTCLMTTKTTTMKNRS